MTSNAAPVWGYKHNRIALSFDGNSAPDHAYKWPAGDPDDWGALAASCAIIAKLDLQDKLVHLSYNNFLDAPAGPDAENQNKISADGAIARWKFDGSNFFDVTTQLEAARSSLADEMAKSTPADPLYFIHAGLSEFVYQAVSNVVAQGKVDALTNVYLVSHSGFNENEKRRSWHHTWADIQALSGNRIQYMKIQDQNDCGNSQHLWCSAKDYSPWYWIRDHKDPNVAWIYTRMVVAGKADISDCGMLFYLLNGDAEGSPEKFQAFIGTGIPGGASVPANTDPEQNLSPSPPANHPLMLWATTNFPNLNAGVVPGYKDTAHKATAINTASLPAGDLGTFAAATTSFSGTAGSYNLTLTTLTERDGECTYRVLVNDVPAGEFTNPRIYPSTTEYTEYGVTFSNITVAAGATLRVEFNSHSNGLVTEDSGFAHARGRWRKLTLTPNVNTPSGVWVETGGAAMMEAENTRSPLEN